MLLFIESKIDWIITSKIFIFKRWK